MSWLPIELSPASQIASASSSSSSTLWAHPSKEWVIPAKPKPGRKPKKGTSSRTTLPKDDIDEESSGGRRLQNRAAQRAFRERKQTQLAELQARLHSYEQGEIERNVALQNIAKKTKEENDELRKENQMLLEKVIQLEQERDELLHKDRKRAYSNESTSSQSFLPTDISARKRARIDGDTQGALSSALHPLFPSPESSVASDSDNGAPAGSLSPGKHEGPSQQLKIPTSPLISNILSFATTQEATSALDGQDLVDSYTCILCSSDAPCVCKEVTVQQAINDGSLHQLPVQNEVLDQQLEQRMHFDASPTASMSTPDDLLASRAPIPIRRRAATSRANSIFPVIPTTTATPSSASKCSGDPDNCMACADDNFGKAFCQAVGHSVNSLPCFDCPKRANQTGEILIGSCCGDINECGSCGIAPMIAATTPQRGPETIPTDDAWRRLKSHPNIAFADLTLLAEVVARRSKCTGSRVVLGSATSAQLTHHEPNSPNGDQSVLLTDPHEHFCQKQRQRELPPQLVPQHVLIECGRRRVREVNADSVREALRLLDQKFAHMR